MDLDLDLLNQVIEMAGKSVRGIGDVASAMQRFKELVQKPEPAGNAELEKIILELMSDIKDAQIANIDLKDQVIKLRQMMIDAQAQNDCFARYELWKAPTGVLVLRLKEAFQTEEPPHYICPRCKEDGKKSILQGNEEFCTCPRCQHGYRFMPDRFKGTVKLREPGIW